MANKLPSKLAKAVKEEVFRQADEFDYCSRNRIENGEFMDRLLEDPKVGGVICDYMERDKVRTYIKDGILNAYAKKYNKQKMMQFSAEDIVRKLYSVEATQIESKNGIDVCCIEGKVLYVVSQGTALKWETALRKGLEYVAVLPASNNKRVKVHICLKLAVANNSMAESDKDQLEKILNLIGVKVFFCE